MRIIDQSDDEFIGESSDGQLFIRRGDAALVWSPYGRDLATLHIADEAGHSGKPCDWLDVESCEFWGYTVKPPRAKLSRPGITRDRAAARYLRQIWERVQQERAAEEAESLEAA